MTTFGVTGTRRMLSDEERWYVHKMVQRAILGWATRGVPRPMPEEFKKKIKHQLVSGVQWGIDTEAVLALWGLIPFENFTLVVPGTAEHNWGLVERAGALGAKIVHSPTLHTAGATYLKRDDVVVELIKVLLAFPNRPTFYRSGTFATINKAKKAGRKVRMYPLCNAC